MSKSNGDRETQISVLQAEYDHLLQEHHMQHQIRENLSLQSMTGFIALIGAILGQFTIFRNNPITLRLFLIMPLFFIFLSIWFVRTNHGNLLIEQFILTVLRPKIAALTGEDAAPNWLVFMWKYESTFRARLVRFIQVFARLGLIYVPVFASLLFFTQGVGGIENYTELDWVLIVCNILCIFASIIIIRETGVIAGNIRRYVAKL